MDGLDEAYERLSQTGPEFDGWLSNHGPMAVEALARHGHGSQIPRWLNGYVGHLERAPLSGVELRDWRTALGDPRMLGPWIQWFTRTLDHAPWTTVLQTWWPRLLPGLVAGATHGVIRVGHAVRVLREDGITNARLTELAHGLGYWAARWQPVPDAAPPGGHLTPAAAMASLPAVPRQEGGINSRLAQLTATAGWVHAQRALAPPADDDSFLRAVVTAAVHRYATYAHGNPVMLVHAATAPNAVLRTLPSLPRDLWMSSATAAWSVSAAVQAAYTPRRGAPLDRLAHTTPEDSFASAVDHGDEHVIKLADTALDVHAWTGTTLSLTAIDTATRLIDPT